MKYLSTFKTRPLNVFASHRSLASIGNADLTEKSIGEQWRDWGTSPGLAQGAPAVFKAADIPRRHKNFLSDLILLSGPRGSGKSAYQNILLQVQKEAMEHDGFPWQLWTNYQREQATVQNPYLLEILQSYPKEARNLSMGVDEIQNATPSRRSLARINLDLSAFLTQIRKRSIDGVFTTQFPSVLDQWIVMQFSLFIRCKAYEGGRIIKCFVFDYWGQYTGNDARKIWPPRIGEHDWEYWIGGVNAIWPYYKTNEIQPPIWTARRDEILGEQGWKFGEQPWQGQDGDGDDKESLEELKETPIPKELEDRAAAALKNMVYQAEGAFPIARYLDSARRSIPTIKTSADFGFWLISQGFDVKKDGNQYVAQKGRDYHEMNKVAMK